MIEAGIEINDDGAWVRVRPAVPSDAVPIAWAVVCSTEGVSDVQVLRRSASLVYVSYVRNGERRKRMLTHAGRSIYIGPDIRAEQRRP